MIDRITSRADYERLRRTFEWECPEYFNFGFDVVDRWAMEQPERTALHWISADVERIVSYAKLSERTNQLANALEQLGLQRSQRVLVILPRVVAWWETLIGLFKAGLVAMPGTSLLTPGDLAYRIKAAEASAVVTDVDGANKIDEIADALPGLTTKIVVGESQRPGWHSFDEIIDSSDDQPPSTQTPSGDPALMYFTSGTTGMPKIVSHTHASYGIGHTVTGRWWLDLHSDDLHWNISDTGWAKAAWSSLFGPMICGAGLFIEYDTGRFNPARVLETLTDCPITTMCAAPTIYRLLIQQDLDSFEPVALRHCVAAGEPLNPEVISAWNQATGLTVRDGYGQTETVLLCANFPGVEVKPGSMGLPTPGIDLAVVDEAGNRLPAGREGQVAVRVEPHRPLGMFREYWQNSQATAQAFHDGWYFTGDCAVTDEDGYFWFEGRADDVISSSAYRIGPFEVESALIEHAAVVEAAVVGKADAVRGQIVKAFVVLAEGFEEGDELAVELQEHVKRVTAPYKYPREIEFLPELPKTVSGKIRRVELRERP